MSGQITVYLIILQFKKHELQPTKKNQLPLWLGRASPNATNVAKELRNMPRPDSQQFQLFFLYLFIANFTMCNFHPKQTFSGEIKAPHC